MDNVWARRARGHLRQAINSHRSLYPPASRAQWISRLRAVCSRALELRLTSFVRRLATRMLVDFCHACVYAEKATSIWHRRLVKRPLEDTFIFKEAWSDVLQKRSLFERRSVQQFTLAFRIEKWLWTPRIQYVVLCFGHLGVDGRTDRRQLNG